MGTPAAAGTPAAVFGESLTPRRDRRTIVRSSARRGRPSSQRGTPIPATHAARACGIPADLLADYVGWLLDDVRGQAADTLAAARSGRDAVARAAFRRELDALHVRLSALRAAVAEGRTGG